MSPERNPAPNGPPHHAPDTSSDPSSRLASGSVPSATPGSPSDPRPSPLAAIATWDVPRAAAGVFDRSGTVAATGPTGTAFSLASVSKVVSAIGVLIAVEEGSIALGDDVGHGGATVAHLLAHAAGFGVDDTEPAAAVGTRRIYSNAGFAVAADHVAAATGMPFDEYLRMGIVEPLGLSATSVDGHPGHGYESSVDDLVRLTQAVVGGELLAASTVEAMTTPFLPDLDGVLPGFGSRTPNPWGLGVEIRGDKAPHWTGTTNSDRTWGHFGRAGTFLWWDPAIDTGAVVLTDRTFGSWAQRAWPPLNDGIVAAGHER